MTARSAAIAVALACAALAAAGCGDDTDTSQGQEVSRVVREFAEADGPEACDLLATQALEDNYGGQGYNDAKDRCEKRAHTFRGARVKITLVKLTSDTTARVNAETLDGKRLYVVTLSKPEEDWVIERIIQQRKE